MTIKVFLFNFFVENDAFLRLQMRATEDFNHRVVNKLNGIIAPSKKLFYKKLKPFSLGERMGQNRTTDRKQ